MGVEAGAGTRSSASWQNACSPQSLGDIPPSGTRLLAKQAHGAQGWTGATLGRTHTARVASVARGGLGDSLRSAQRRLQAGGRTGAGRQGRQAREASQPGVCKAACQPGRQGKDASRGAPGQGQSCHSTQVFEARGRGPAQLQFARPSQGTFG